MKEGSAYAMFELLGSHPLSLVTSIVAVAVVVTFFVTSADSGSQVIAMVTAGGKLDVPRHQRMLWAIVVGVVAAALLIGGGLDTLQTDAITTGLPFAVVVLLQIYTLFNGLAREHAVLQEIETPSTLPDGAGISNDPPGEKPVEWSEKD